MKLAGVCAVAVLVVVVLGASSASAAEVGECLRLAPVEGHVHGKYTDKNCQVPATPSEEAEGKANKWEWSPGVTPAHAGFTAKTKSASLVGAAGTVECRKKGTTVGEWTGPKTATEQITFTDCAIHCGCELVSVCHSAGQPEGTIVTNPLEVMLLGEGEASLEWNQELEGGKGAYEPELVGAGEVWEQVRGPGGELTSVPMEYECGMNGNKEVVLRAHGSLAGVLTPVGIAAKKFEVAFDQGKGAQGLTQEASILGKGFVPIGKGVLKMTPQVKATGKIEFRT